jgi:lysophospholipase L1-like esterase
MFHRFTGMAIVLIFSTSLIYPGSVAQAGPVSVKDKEGGQMEATQVSGKPGSGASGGAIIIIGASYAAGLELETLMDRQVINKGVGGEQSFESLARFDQEIIAEKPAAVILWGFINDIFRSDREKVDAALERIKSSYVAMIEKARQNGVTPIVATEVTMSLRPGFKAWVRSLIPRMMSKTSYQEYINGHVMRVNQWLKKYADENGILLLDLQAVLAEGGVMRKTRYAQADGSHISDEGYRRIKEYIRANVRALK